MKKEEQVLDFEVTENIDMLLDKEVILYGTASYAERLYPLIKKAGLNVVGCCDGSEKRIGGYFHEWTIERFSDISKRLQLENVVIIICSTFVSEIMEDCNKICPQELRFLSPFGFQTAFVLNRNNPKLNSEFRKWYNQQYDIWSDLQRDSSMAHKQNNYNKKLIRFMQSDNILLYQAGKVGSASVSTSLSACGIGNIHIHFFQPWMNGILPQNSKNYLEKVNQIIRQKEEIKIITLVRDPIARDISAVFQDIEDLSRDEYQDLSWNIVDGIKDILCRDCDGRTYIDQAVLNDTLENNDFDRNRPWLFQWFDLELKEIFGIDVYAHPFDREKGCSVIKQNNVECMIIKLEKLDSCADEIAEFIGEKNFTLLRDNVGDRKTYSYLYNKCKQALVLPENLIDFYYSGDSIRHFYTEKEIEEFRKNWNIV